ncbi:MAG: DNA polymerase III subunit delta [Chitinophagaceae bacterium]
MAKAAKEKGLDFDSVMQQLVQRKTRAVYWLEGEEAYFIDKLMHYAEHELLSPAEAGFNLTIFYGKDADWAAMINACRKYPMFAERQVVLLKEAQHMKDLDKLEGYIDNPLTSTIFIVGHKEKTIDGRSTLKKLLTKKDNPNVTYFLSEKLPDYKLDEWVRGMLQQHKLQMNDQALRMLVDHVGNDLNRLENEVEKITINLKGSNVITADHIETYVGISKEFNAFEFQDAVAVKDFAKAIRIIQYFDANPKAGSIHLLLPTLYGFFSKLAQVHALPSKDEQNVKPLFFYNSFAAQKAIQASRLYSYPAVERALLLLHLYNLKSLGVDHGGASEVNLMKELLVKIMA